MLRQYYKVFHVLFTDGSEMFCEPDKGEYIIEAVERYRANTEQNYRLRLLDIMGEGIQFECNDVLSYQWGEMGGVEYSLLYPQRVRMFKRQPVAEAMELYYVVAEEDILCLIKT